MLLHLSEPITDIRHITKSVEQLVKLYAANYLLDDSEVWIRTRDQRYIWTLTDRSSLISINTLTHPGAVRVTNGRIRTGSTFEQAQNDPDDAIYFDQLDDKYGISTSSNYTQIIDHAMEDEYVKIIDQSESRQLENGQYLRDGIGIVDLCHYQRNNIIYVSPDRNDYVSGGELPPNDGQLWTKELAAGEVSEYERGHATYNGSAFITAGLSRRKREHYRKHYAQYTLNLEPHYMNNLVDLLINGYRRAAEGIQVAYNQELSGLEIPEDEAEPTEE